MQCPKCGHVRQPDSPAPAGQCPDCGIIYQKFTEARAARRAQLAERGMLHSSAHESARTSAIGTLATVIVLVAGLAVWLYADSRPVPPATTCGDAGYAYVMSQRIARNNLLAPSSAKFPAAPLSSQYQGACQWSIVAEVDAQNAFGVMLPHHYHVTMIYDPTAKTWRGTDFDISAR